jgi:hypothetical protein
MSIKKMDLIFPATRERDRNGLVEIEAIRPSFRLEQVTTEK